MYRFKGIPMDYDELKKKGIVREIKKRGFATLDAADKGGILEFVGYFDRGHDWDFDPMGQDPNCRKLEAMYRVLRKG